METPTFVFLTICLLCFAEVFCGDFGEVGADVTLTPVIYGKPEEIVWKHNGDKVVEYDGSEVTTYSTFEGRVEIDFQTGQLTIRKLTGQDSGQYQSDIVINGKIQTFRRTLKVLDAFPEPRVTCEHDETSDRNKLVCSVDSQTQLTYMWTGPNVKDHPGPELFTADLDKDSDYNCTVKSDARSRSTRFNLQDCGSGGAMPGVLVGIIIGVIIIFLLLGIGLAFFFWRRDKAKSNTSEAKENDPERGSLLKSVQAEEEKKGGDEEKTEEDEDQQKMDQTNTGSTDATLPSPAGLTAPNKSISQRIKNFESNNGNQDLNSQVAFNAQSHQSREMQEEENKEENPKPEMENGTAEESSQQQNEGLKNLKAEDARKDKDEQTAEEKDHEETDQSNTGSPETNQDLTEQEGVGAQTQPSSEKLKENENKEENQNEKGEKFPEQHNEGLKNQKIEETSKNPADHEETDQSNTETAVKEEDKVNTENKKQLDPKGKESSHNENGEQKSLTDRPTGDPVNNEPKSGEKKEEGKTDQINIANLVKEPKSSSVSSSDQTDPSDKTEPENSLTEESDVDSDELKEERKNRRKNMQQKRNRKVAKSQRKTLQMTH